MEVSSLVTKSVLAVLRAKLSTLNLLLYAVMTGTSCTPLFHIAALITTLVFACAQDNCGSIGNNNETPASVDTDMMFYLNTANPAPCAGNITSWRVCYYGPNDNLHRLQQRTYWATYAVYRRLGPGENERYERVSVMYSAVRTARSTSADVVDGLIQQSGFNC